MTFVNFSFGVRFLVSHLGCFSSLNGLAGKLHQASEHHVLEVEVGEARLGPSGGLLPLAFVSSEARLLHGSAYSVSRALCIVPSAGYPDAFASALGCWSPWLYLLLRDAPI